MSRGGLLLLLVLVLVGALTAWGRSAYHLSLARDKSDTHQLKSAWHHLQQARRTWPFRARSHLLAARVARRLGDIDQARAHLDAHERLGGDGRDRTFERTLLLVQSGELAEGEKDLLDLLQQGNHPDSALILEALARGYLIKNHNAGLERLLQLWPDQLVVSCWRGRAHYYLGHFPEAIVDLTPFVAQEPDWDELRLELAHACYQAGRSAEALSHYRHLQDRNPSSPDVLFWLAMCLQDQSQLDEAATVLDRLLQLAPNHLTGLVERGRVAFRQGQPRLGERWARQAIASSPTPTADAHLILARCLEAQGKSSEGKKQLERWQALDAAQYHLRQVLPQLAQSPDDVDLLFQSGSIFLFLGNNEEGMKALDRVLQLSPDHRPTHRLLAEHYSSLGQLELAREHQKRAMP
jgi:tetratricopeptide (TPR) repeat protein